MRRVARTITVLAAGLLLAGAPLLRAHALEGGNADTDVDDDEGIDMPSGTVRDPDEITPPDAKPRAHDEIPFPDAKPRPHDEIQPPDVKFPQ
jgi:hypothetical protein